MATPIYRTGMPAEKQYQYSSTTQGVYVENIIIGDRSRKLDEPTVKKIYDSIADHGLIQPICVRSVKDQPGFHLVVGAHRLEAWLRRWREGDESDKTHQNRWASIPAIIYQNDMTEEQMKLIELRENLERKELSKSEHDTMNARVLELTQEKAQTPKRHNSKKGTSAKWSPPPQKDIYELLGIKSPTFRKDFKSYQQDAAISVNWTKLTKSQYDGFIAWFKDRAAKREAEEMENQENDEQAQADAQDELFWKSFGAIKKRLIDFCNENDERRLDIKSALHDVLEHDL